MTPARTGASGLTLVAASAIALALCAPAGAREVTVPIRLDHEFLRRGFEERVYTDRGTTARAWDDGSGCNYLILSAPRVDARDGRLRVVSAAEARVGTTAGSMCLTTLDWRGFVEIFEAPEIDPAAPIVRFRIVDSNLYDQQWRKQRALGTVWDWVKRYVHPRLAVMTVDLHAPLVELRGFLPLVLPSPAAARTEALLASVALAGAAPTEEGLTVSIRFDVAEAPPAGTPPAPGPEPTLSPDEIRRWEAALERWDAFVTFVIKRAGTDTAAGEVRQALFDVLLDARHDALDALAPSGPGAPDPVPGLFLRTWERLAPVLRGVSTGLPGEQALRYLSFISAAEALRAIAELGPASGLDISADGMRRLARIVAPDAVEDPLAFSLDVDPALRQLFGFGPPLPLPPENPDVDLSGWFLGTAWAAIEPIDTVISRLNRWVPTIDQLDEYLPTVRDLLVHTSAEILRERTLDQRFHTLYRWIVLATAWQETCWRQFVRDQGGIKPITSPAGSVGIMQVNPRAWRGFYDLPALKRDIGYNAKAGGEIALHYLVDLAIAKKEHAVTGGIDNLARATYAAYNGGPRHLRRYRNPKTSKRLRLIDKAFWDKFTQVKGGNDLAVASCYGG